MDPMKDKKVLSYHDTVLRKSDLDILKGPCYLNDRIIEFYFSYITSCYQSNDILLVAPTISFWLANCQESELEDFVQHLNLRNKQLIIFTVNDNDDVSQTDGGNHWSLLVYFRKSNSFVHHDSLGGMNRDPAVMLYDAVKGFVGSGKKKKNLMTAILAPADSNPSYPSFKKGFTPRQTNFYDCGLYVMAITRVICQWYFGLSSYSDNDFWFSAVEDHVDISVELTMRTELLDIIEELR